MSSKSKFEEELNTIYQTYRRKNLHNNLNDIAETLEHILIEITLSNVVFDKNFELNKDLIITIKETREYIKSKDFDELESEINKLENKVKKQNRELQNEVHELRTQKLETIRAIRELNKRTEKINPQKLISLEKIFDNWGWESEIKAETFDKKREKANQYGKTLKKEFENVKKVLDEFKGTEIEELSYRLLEGDNPNFGELSEEEKEKLAASSLAEYIELSLSD